MEEVVKYSRYWRQRSKKYIEKSVEGSQENEQMCFSEIKNSGISDKISGSNFGTKKTQFS